MWKLRNNKAFRRCGFGFTSVGKSSPEKSFTGLSDVDGKFTLSDLEEFEPKALFDGDENSDVDSVDVVHGSREDNNNPSAGDISVAGHQIPTEIHVVLECFHDNSTNCHAATNATNTRKRPCQTQNASDQADGGSQKKECLDDFSDGLAKQN